MELSSKIVSGILLTLLLMGMLTWTFSIQQVRASEPPQMAWNKTYGGAGWDWANSVIQTSDGGYALAGWTDVYGAGDSESPDFWLVKIDASGNVQWNKTYGGTGDDYANSVVQTGDNGYALAGRTDSYGAGDYDFWLVKTDSAGNIEWNKTSGGTDWDKAYSLVQTDDGYVLAGATASFGAGLVDCWLIKIVTVTGPSPPTVQVGFMAGDWTKCSYTVSGWPAGTPYPEWLKVEFLSVEGTSATVRVTMHMSDGREQNTTVPVDVVAGGQALGLSGFVIPANLTTGDVVYVSGYGNVTIAGETTRTYAGASRTVVYASFSQYGTQLTYYWDKQTGVMVEASMISGTMTGTAKVTETNLWEAAPPPFWTQWWLWATVTVVIVALAGAVYLLKKRKPPPTPTAPTSTIEGTQQNTYRAQVVTGVYKQEHSPLNQKKNLKSRF